MDFINHSPYLSGETVHAVINGVDPTCAPKSESRDNSLSNREVQTLLGFMAQCDAKIDYEHETLGLIADLQNYVKCTVEQEKEMRKQKGQEEEAQKQNGQEDEVQEQNRQEMEKKKIEYDRTFAVTLVLKMARDFLRHISNPVVIKPDKNIVRFSTIFPTINVSVDCDITVSEIRTVAKQVPEFVLLDNMVDTSNSLCLDLQINMPKEETLSEDEMQQLLDATSQSEL